MADCGKRLSTLPDASRAAGGGPNRVIMPFTSQDLFHNPSSKSHLRATGRRSWRPPKVGEDSVWDLELEELLLQGLAKFGSSTSFRAHTYRTGYRFSGRSQYISRYIHSKSGKLRTEKQIGSRLQQLQRTSNNSKILNLISQGSLDISEDDSELEPEPAPQSSQACLLLRQVVLLDRPVAVQSTLLPHNIPKILLTDDLGHTDAVQIRAFSSLQRVSDRSPAASLLHLQPVDIVSSWKLDMNTTFTIYDGIRAVEQEKGSLRLIAWPQGMGGFERWVYQCALAIPIWRATGQFQSGSQNRMAVIQSLSVTTATRPSHNISIAYSFGGNLWKPSSPPLTLPSTPLTPHTDPVITSTYPLPTIPEWTNRPQYSLGSHTRSGGTDEPHDFGTPGLLSCYSLFTDTLGADTHSILGATMSYGAPSTW